MKKTVWKCGACSVGNTETSKPDRSRKGSRVDNSYIENESIDIINAMLELLLNITNEINNKMDLFMEENRLLKCEIATLKKLQPQMSNCHMPQL